jgi:hypothetical protein
MKILELTGHTSEWAIDENVLYQWCPSGALYMHGIYKTKAGFDAIGQKPVKVKVTVEVVE